MHMDVGIKMYIFMHIFVYVYTLFYIFTDYILHIHKVYEKSTLRIIYIQ